MSLYDKKVFMSVVSLSLIILMACAPKHGKSTQNTNNPMIWQKVKIDFKKLDGEGLSGPTNGKVAMNYEFCLPKVPSLWEKAQNIDKTLKRSESKGRVGCSKAEWLCIGSTHQEEYMRVLYDLASMEEVKLIQEVFYE